MFVGWCFIWIGVVYCVGSVGVGWVDVWLGWVIVIGCLLVFGSVVGWMYFYFWGGFGWFDGFVGDCFYVDVGWWVGVDFGIGVVCWCLMDCVGMIVVGMFSGFIGFVLVVWCVLFVGDWWYCIGC